MKPGLWLVDKLFGRRIARQSREQLAHLANTPVRESRGRTSALLDRLASEPGPHVHLGDTEWGQPLRLSLSRLIQGHSFITGGTGSGKTMAAGLLIEALLRAEGQDISFGVLDAKGELFARTLYLIAARLQGLPDAQAQRLKGRIVIIDLSSADPVSSYNIAAPWAGSDLDFFAQSRVDTLQELLPSGDGLSLRGGGIVKHVIKLMAELRLPFRYFDRILGSEAFRNDLLARSCDDDLKHYFQQHFPSENRSTIAAVRARVATTLLSSQSLKLALSGHSAPDFRELQDYDERNIVLINCSGPNIPRTTARTLQALIVSDIRQAVFARHSQRTFLWICDEAQNFFRTSQLRENMTDLLTMSRSYGSFFLYLTQNLATAVQDSEMVETLHTNIRWSLSMRGTARDGIFLQAAMPITGRLQKPRMSPYAPPEFYRAAKERQQLLSTISSLPDRVGWLWLKSLTGEAMKIKTRTLELPASGEFHEMVDRLKADAAIGQRIPRSAYLADIERREKELGMGDTPNKLEDLKKVYQRAREASE